MPSPGSIQAFPLRGIPEIQPGDSVIEAILASARRSRVQIRRGDILVVKHKIISKAEGRVIALSSVTPSRQARLWAERWHRDPRVIALALQNAQRVVRMKNGVLITETPHGFVCANSGVDLSNVDGGASAVLLPVDPDASARRLMRALRRALEIHVPVIIADTFGRAWREGLTEVAIGVAGLKPLRDFRGQRDKRGYKMHATAEAVADELAAVAGLVCGKLDGIPACIVRGYQYSAGRGAAKELIRPASRDLFR
jgi:coenzyme F420-0:L-glutamate ligase/coenzyme F420-1:gamma-L-glutamate ligase